MDFDTFEDLQEFFSKDEFATKCLGAKVDSFDYETGVAVVSMDIDGRHHNAQGFAMGGVFLSLADFACAVASNVGQEPSSSISCSMQFMRRVKDNHLRAIASPDKVGHSTTCFTIDVVDGADTHVARMQMTCLRTNR